MEDNIEVKDVQKTEYLDKNGLDMLWTKVKENTHNQVEVERNRAVAKENSITNSFSDFVSKTTTDAQTINSDLLINRGSLTILGGTGPEDEETEDKKREGLGLFPTLIQFGEDNDTSGIELRGNAAAGPVNENGDGYITGSCINIETRRENPSIQLYSTISRTDSHKSNIGDSLTIDNRSVFIRDTNEVYSSGSDDTFEVQGLVRGANLTATCISLQDKQSNNGIIIENNPTDNYIMLSHGTNQAKYLKITGGGIACNGGSVISGNGLFFEANGRLSDIYHTSGQMIVRQFDRLNTEVSDQGVFVGNNTADGQRGIQITGNGIQIEETTQVPVNKSSDKVFATDGSIADLTQYAKKSEITAGGNVNDVQVNGVSVVENKVANIKPATKEKLGVVKVGDGLNVTDGTISVDTTAIGTGNYIPYESIENNMYATKSNEGILFKSSSGDISIHQNCINVKNEDNKISILSDQIWLQEITNDGQTETIQFRLDRDGLYLYGGDNHSVLTSGGSTIDITQYAKKSEIPTVPTKVSQLQNDSKFIAKSVYDEKIAALEARIAALEAKHVEV